MPAGQVVTEAAEPLASISGYPILEGSEADVQAALNAHPFVARGGTLQLNAVLDLSQLAQQG